MIMAEKRQEIVSLKTTKKIKTRLKAAADSQHRTLSNMLEVIVIRWCDDHKIESVRPFEPAADKKNK
jgi:hypothetical protein